MDLDDENEGFSTGSGIHGGVVQGAWSFHLLCGIAREGSSQGSSLTPLFSDQVSASFT